VTSLVLVPEQPALLLGAEVIFIGFAMVIAPVVFQARAWRARKDAWERYMRAVSTTGFSLPFVIGGALLFEGARSSLYWIAAGDILGVIAVVLSAWVLMVEILR
jgi:predicted MFS family arabinose efflux permease